MHYKTTDEKNCRVLFHYRFMSSVFSFCESERIPHNIVVGEVSKNLGVWNRSKNKMWAKMKVKERQRSAAIIRPSSVDDDDTKDGWVQKCVGRYCRRRLKEKANSRDKRRKEMTSFFFFFSVIVLRFLLRRQWEEFIAGCPLTHSSINKSNTIIIAILLLLLLFMTRVPRKVSRGRRKRGLCFPCSLFLSLDFSSSFSMSLSLLTITMLLTVVSFSVFVLWGDRVFQLPISPGVLLERQ